jgi:hypothetical protein
MSYQEDTDRWIDDLLMRMADEGMNLEVAKIAIRERILQSFKNGLKVKERRVASALQKPPQQA